MIEHWNAFQPIPVAAANPHPMFGALPKFLPMPCMEASPVDRAIIAGFAGLFYRKQNVRAAFQTYAAPEMIQHDPGLADGAEAAIDGLKPILSRPATHITIAHVLACRGMGVIHMRSRSGRNPGHITFDIMRIDGGKIVEHWDVIQPIASATISSRHPA